MGLKVPDPNAISDKQWDFIVNLCADTLSPLPRRESLNPEQASDLIEELKARKGQMEKEMQEPELPPTIDEIDYFKEDPYWRQNEEWGDYRPNVD